MPLKRLASQVTRNSTVEIKDLTGHLGDIIAKFDKNRHKSICSKAFNFGSQPDKYFAFQTVSL
jgi:hypothetical protein